MKRSLRDRIEGSVAYEPNTGCWLWVRAKSVDGYGRIKIDGENVSAHRTSYAAYLGPIPEGLTIDHLCRTRLCVNPDHLEAVPMGVNVLRGMNTAAQNARKTHCKRGHALEGGNLYVTRVGERRCKQCRRDGQREWKLRGSDPNYSGAGRL